MWNRIRNSDAKQYFWKNWRGLTTKEVDTGHWRHVGHESAWWRRSWKTLRILLEDRDENIIMQRPATWWWGGDKHKLSLYRLDERERHTVKSEHFVQISKLDNYLWMIIVFMYLHCFTIFGCLILYIIKHCSML